MKKKSVQIAVDEEFRQMLKEMSAQQKKSMIELSKDLANKNRDKPKRTDGKDLFW